MKLRNILFTFVTLTIIISPLLLTSCTNALGVKDIKVALKKIT